MGVAELVPQISRADCFGIRATDAVDPEEGAQQREMTRHGIVEPSQEAVDRVRSASVKLRAS